MALVQFGSHPFEADLVALDKDGTLIEFEPMWGRLAEAWVTALTANIDGRTGEDVAQELYQAWGFDPLEGRTLPQGPWASATTGQLQTIAASVLYRHGYAWLDAIDRARLTLQQATQELSRADLVQPVGDVAGLVGKLRAAGIRVAVITTDHRAETQKTLRLLGIEHLVDHVVCGDDGLASKPAPDMLLAAFRRLGANPARAAVVGDTLADLHMAERAKAGLKVAVRSGAGAPELLSAHADIVIDSIDDITV
jgi:HAD superfamily hydrolase (TIGR01509 family)